MSVGLDTVWALIAAFLVFFMQAGFGAVEAGFIRAKNTANILMKNFIDYCVASLMFYAVGYAFMFGVGNDFIGWTGFGMKNAPNPSGVPLLAFLLFQTAFAGAAATIVAGAMAERMKFIAYFIYTIIVSAVIYPIVGHWIWGGGWLAKLGFGDFAGSTVVHTVGGIIAFIGAKILGPRIGKFNSDGSPNVLAGHNIPLATVGVFILWFGWFGFNPGSTLAVKDGVAISLIAMNTNLAASAGAISTMLLTWILYKKPDLSMTMNGILAGLVAITAPCAYVSPLSAIIIGGIAGVIVVYGVKFVDWLFVDDPVGAVAVHGLNGIWGTLSVGLFAEQSLGVARNGLFFGGGFEQLLIQLLGSLSVIIFCLISMGFVFWLMKKTIGLRVKKEEEIEGLDIGEHGIESYPDFQVLHK